MRAKSFFDIEYDKITLKIAKKLILLGGLLIALFFGFIIYSIFFNVDSSHNLGYEDELVMRVNKIRDSKGFLILNDSLIISNNIKAIDKPQYQKDEVLIKYICKPYILKKEKNSYDFQVIDNQFTYTFQLFKDNGL